jgi:hypothetical protein
MIKRFVDAFMENKSDLEEQFSLDPPGEYRDIVHAVVSILSDGSGNTPDPERIHEIDDGDRQGTLVYVIGANDYQPDRYWYVCVYYGSCPACDALLSIQNITPATNRTKAYMRLALHVVQRMKKLDGKTVNRQ